MWTLGINAPPAGWHDPAVCLVDDRGEVVAYVEEERRSRSRHAYFASPAAAMRHCLERAGIGTHDVDVVAVGWETAALFPDLPAGDAEFLAAALGWTREDGQPRVVHVGHHLAHATSAFYASPFEAAGVLVVDGVGEYESTSVWRFERGREPVRHRSWPRHCSLGYAYDAASRWLGFSFSDAGKTMGLAAYGRAAGVDPDPLVELTSDDFTLRATKLLRDPDRFTAAESASEYRRVLAAWRRVFEEIGGGRGPERGGFELAGDPGAVRVAWSAQVLVEQTVEWLAEQTRSLTGLAPLCIAGGVGLNCSTNGRLPAPVYVPPVPHDAGVALGAAWSVRPPRGAPAPLTPFLGPSLGSPSTADLGGLRRAELSIEAVAAMLLDGRVGAIAEGRSEVGPRALCHRSIVAVPRPAEVHGRVNAIKNREPWRPFGPVTRRADARHWWRDVGELSRYMVGAAEMTGPGREAAPAACHVDGTTRPQELRGGEAPVVEALLDELGRQGAAPVLVNTSFNDRGQPIVDSAPDALAAAQSLELDFLVLDDALLLPARHR